MTTRTIQEAITETACNRCDETTPERRLEGGAELRMVDATGDQLFADLCGTCRAELGDWWAAGAQGVTPPFLEVVPKADPAEE